VRYHHTFQSANVFEMDFALPSAGRLSQLSVVCDDAVRGASKTLALLVNGVASSVACTIAPGDSTCTNSLDSADYAAGDLIALRSSCNGRCNGPICAVSAAVRGFGGAGEHDAIVAWGGKRSSPPGDRFCGPSDFSDAATRCRSRYLSEAAMVMPAAGRLSGIAVTLSANPSTGKSESYSVYNVTKNRSSDELVIDANARSGAIDCSTNCDFDAGDLLTIHFTRQGDRESRYRHIALELSGIGQVVASGDKRAPRTRGGQAQFGFSHAQPYRMERDGRLRNLHVRSNVEAGTDTTVTLCAGPSVPPPCTTTLSCTVAAGTMSCSNTAEGVDLPAGSYYSLEAATQDRGAGRITFSLEVNPLP
jgi:hypothetical protein